MTLPAVGAALQRLQPESRGILGLVTAMLLFVSMDACAKYLVAHNPTVMVVWARFMGQTVLILLLFGHRMRRLLTTAHPGLQAARSVLNLVAASMFITALGLMGLAEATAVFETAPLLITAFAFLILGEQVGPRRWAAVIIGLCGALIIIRPGLEVFQPAALLPLGTATCLALIQIIQRRIGTADRLETSVFFMGLGGTVVTSLVVPFYWVTPTLADAVLLAVFGWIGFGGNMLLFYALTQAPAATPAPLNYTGFLWALLIGLLVFGELPDAITLVGAAIILGSGIYVWHRERRLAREQAARQQ